MPGRDQHRAPPVTSRLRPAIVQWRCSGARQRRRRDRADAMHARPAVALVCTCKSLCHSCRRPLALSPLHLLSCRACPVCVGAHSKYIVWTFHAPGRHHVLHSVPGRGGAGHSVRGKGHQESHGEAARRGSEAGGKEYGTRPSTQCRAGDGPVRPGDGGTMCRYVYPRRRTRRGVVDHGARESDTLWNATQGSHIIWDLPSRKNQKKGPDLNGVSIGYVAWRETVAEENCWSL